MKRNLIETLWAIVAIGASVIQNLSWLCFIVLAILALIDRKD
jgi:hypothetical protein